MGLLERCKDIAQKEPLKIVFSDALDKRVIEAALQLQKYKLAHPVLMGNPFAIRKLLQAQSVPLSALTVIDHNLAKIKEQNKQNYMDICQEKGRIITEEQAEKFVSCPLVAGAMMLDKGEVDMGIAGNLSSTGDVIRAGLRILGTSSGTKTVSSLFFMIPPGEQKRVLVFTDAGVVPMPSVSQLADIAIASAENMQKVTKEIPRVALLSFSTKGSAKHERVTFVQEALEEIKKRQPTLFIDGELQFDAAIVPSVAAAKAPNSPIKGRANILVFPSLEAGNISYKIAQRLGGYKALGPFLQGFQKPWHDLSRGCSVNDIFEVALVGSALFKGNTNI